MPLLEPDEVSVELGNLLPRHLVQGVLVDHTASRKEKKKTPRYEQQRKNTVLMRGGGGWEVKVLCTTPPGKVTRETPLSDCDWSRRRSAARSFLENAPDIRAGGARRLPLPTSSPPKDWI